MLSCPGEKPVPENLIGKGFNITCFAKAKLYSQQSICSWMD